MEIAVEADVWFRRNAESELNEARMYALEAIRRRGGAGRPETAVMIRDAADRGNLRAAGNLADMMVSGKGVRKDLSAASSLYAAVAKGPARGRAVPAKAADDGRTGQCDPGLSFRLFKQAADNGDQYAMYAVACMYRDGKGTSEDREKYKFYTRMAADFGNRDAKEIVGKWDAKEKKRRKAAKKADP
ncbi:tetratricopeptide repeat protein [Methanomethylophilus alvi]|uniref:tetratricopeptide repeat protein n=1 Tax=Methanomethylophilus alvi TaxID=1291540 RepID=UPI0037DCF9D0